MRVTGYFRTIVATPFLRTITLAGLVLPACKSLPQQASDAKIFNGHSISQTSPAYRSTVKLMPINGEASMTCSGVVIAPRLVLTAAHCVYPNATAMQVMFEKIDGKSAAAPMPGDVTVKGIGFIHDKYKPKQEGDILEPAFDVALIVLDSQIPASYEPVALVAPDQTPQPGGRYLLAGYGYQTREKLGARFELERDLTAVFNRPKRPNLMYFAPHLEGGAANGDSGGPAYIWSKRDNKYLVAGITSFGFNLGSGEAFYTSIQGYLDWLEAVARQRLGAQFTPFFRAATPVNLANPTPDLAKLTPYQEMSIACPTGTLDFQFFENRGARLTVRPAGGTAPRTLEGMVLNYRLGDPTNTFNVLGYIDTWRFVDFDAAVSYQVERTRYSEAAPVVSLWRRGADEFDSISHCTTVATEPAQ